MLELKSVCSQHREQLTKINIEMKNHELWVQIQELKDELETFRKSLSKASQPIHMDN